MSGPDYILRAATLGRDSERRRILEIVKALELVELRIIKGQEGAPSARALAAYATLGDLARAITRGTTLAELDCEEDIAAEARRAVGEALAQSGGRS